MDSPEQDDGILDLPPSAEFRDEEPIEPDPAPEPAEEIEPEPDTASPEEQGAGEEPETPDDWQARFENEEKRRKDSQRSFNEEHQARLRLEKELADLRAQGAPALDPDSDEIDEDAFYDDPVKALQTMKAQQRQQIEAMQQQQQQQRILMLEDMARAKHNDYDELVTDYLVPEMQNDSVLAAEWRKNGGTPEVAYDMAKRLRAIRTPSEPSESPTEMEARIRKELEAELQGRTPKPGRTLSGAGNNSPPPKLKKGEVNLPEDPSELLALSLS